ncbi:MAG TPA: RNA polymerase sigma factor [Candidatus Cloacimonadota bacterium]|nr:RNA polymerase sigma factor [Candidatus Cloacimonadota bacterium]
MKDIEEIINEHEDALMGFAISLTHSEALAEDLIQDTWLKSLSYSFMLSSLPSNKQRSWLFSVLKNRFYDICRQNKREKLKLEEKEYFSPQEVKEIINWEPYLTVLPEKEREIIRLRFWDGLNSKEIGSRLKISDSTVRWHLSNGLKTLKNNVERKWR